MLETVALLLVCAVLARGVMAVAEDLGVATWEGTRDAGARAYRAANERYGRVRAAAVAKAERMPAANPKHPGWWLWLIGAAGYHGARNLRRGVREAGEIITGGWRRGTAEGNAWKAEVLQRRSNAKNPNERPCEMAGDGCTPNGVVAYREDVDPAAWLCRDHWRARRTPPPPPSPALPSTTDSAAPGAIPSEASTPAPSPAPSATGGQRVPEPRRDEHTSGGSGRPGSGGVRCEDCGVAQADDVTVGEWPDAPAPWSVLCIRCRRFHLDQQDAAGTQERQTAAAAQPAETKESTEGNTMSHAAVGTFSPEVSDISVMRQTAQQLREMAARDAEAAQQAINEADKRISALDALSANLAAHGIGGPLMEAIAGMSENATLAKTNAQERAANADKDKRDADKASAAVTSHEAAADSLSATGGAAKTTAFYGQQH